jgi:hypothetical protein
MLEELMLKLVKEESEYGTDPTPTAADNAILVSGVKFKEVAEPAERSGKSSSLSPLASKLGSVYVEISFQAELKGSGTKGVAPRIGDLLEACGMTEGAVVGSSVSYLPKSSGVKSVTIWLYKDGRKHVINGARGTVKITTPANKVGICEFTMKGLYTPPTDTTLPTNAVFEASVPPVCKGGSVSLNSVTTLAIEQSELDLGNEVSTRPSKTATYGIAGVDITKRKPTLSINPEAVAISVLDIRALMLTTPVAYQEVIGSTDGNIITIAAPKLNLEAPEYGDREGITTETLKGTCTKNSDAGNDEVSIIFT